MALSFDSAYNQTNRPIIVHYTSPYMNHVSHEQFAQFFMNSSFWGKMREMTKCNIEKMIHSNKELSDFHQPNNDRRHTLRVLAHMRLGDALSLHLEGRMIPIQWYIDVFKTIEDLYPITHTSSSSTHHPSIHFTTSRYFTY